jgi:hypothetical protein
VDFVRRDPLLIQRYGVDGAPIGAPTEVTFDEYHGFGNPGYTAYEAAWVLAWDDGSFLVAWRELDVTNRSDLGTSHFVSQRYAAAGQAVGTPRTIAFSALGYGVVTVAFTEMDDGGYLTAQTFFNSGVPTYRFVPFDSADRTSAIPASWPGLPQFTRLLPLATEGHLLRAGAAGPFTQILDDTGALVAQPAVHAGDVHVLADGGFVAVWRGSAPAGQPDLLVQR